jgi:hypothetical protein
MSLGTKRKEDAPSAMSYDIHPNIVRGPTASQMRRVNASGEVTSDPMHVQTTK